MTIQLITFDLDDTLWDVASVMHSAENTLRDWLAAHAPQLGGVPIEHLWAIRARLLAAEPGLKHRLSALRRRILLLALQEAGYSGHEAEPLAEAGFQVFLEARHQVSLFAEVHPTLEHLANHYQLGVITNGIASAHCAGAFSCWRCKRPVIPTMRPSHWPKPASRSFSTRATRSACLPRCTRPLSTWPITTN